MPPAAGREEQATLTVKVEGRDILNLRKALVGSGAPGARILDCRRVAHSTALQVRVGCERNWTGVIMRCVMQTVSAAEFGRCEAVPA